MSSNHLLLKPATVHYIWLGMQQACSKTDKEVIQLWFPKWDQQLTVCKLGVLTEEKLSMADQMNSLCRFCHYQPLQLEVIWSNLLFSVTLLFWCASTIVILSLQACWSSEWVSFNPPSTASTQLLINMPKFFNKLDHNSPLAAHREKNKI